MRSSDRLFFDSDIFVLLAGAGLLPDFVHACGLDLSETRRLEPLPFMLDKGPLGRKYSEGVRQRAKAWCSEIPPIEEVPSPAVIGQLVEIPDLDPGEAYIFALAAESEGALIATGDKRACLALSAAEGLDELRGRLKGRVVCLETALCLVADRMDYSTLATALIPLRETSQTLRVLLSEGEMTPREDFRVGLESYLNDLLSKAGDLLLPGPWNFLEAP